MKGETSVDLPAPSVRRRPWPYALAGVLVPVLAAPLVIDDPHTLHTLLTIFLYAALGQAWNILGGYTGQVSLGHAVFFGTGAYVSTFMYLKLGITPWLGMLAGVAAAVALALIIGSVCFRLQGHYFVIATLAVGEITQTLAINWKAIGGATGLSLPIQEGFLAFQWGSKLPYYYLALALLGLAFGITYYLERSRAGYYFRAIKAEPLAARCLGIPIARYKLLALTISAGLTAMGGTFLAQYVLYIDPFSVLALHLSVLIAMMAVVGGTGTLWGPLVGAVVLVPLSEYTRIAFSGSAKAIDLMLYGALIVLMALYQPAGLMGIFRRLQRRAA